MKPWIGVDLDGTLAEFHPVDDLNSLSFNPTGIGEPIQLMVDKVKCLLDRGDEVKIFTARVSEEWPERCGASKQDIREAIDNWLLKTFGRLLPVTCTKDSYCIELWDDIARSVVRNTGRIRG
ncbi:hypothetical protein LCGC14_1989030 [marine sediment metagenome]|uniref:FCP1 homology domain-containing protein n=1 Tax=marine sediment metagenome TaxID=412755 RepID=A0A0F9I3N8_9ZZZZ